MTWCSVKAQGQLYKFTFTLTLPYLTLPYLNVLLTFRCIENDLFVLILVNNYLFATFYKLE